MLGRLLAPLSSKIILGLILALMLSGFLLRHEHSRANKNALALETTKVAYETMQKAATAWATANKIHADQANNANKEKADVALDLAVARDAAGADAYARSHRVCRQAAPGGAGSTDLPAASSAAESSNRPGGVAPVDDWVIIERKYFNRCTDYTRRLSVGHDWSLGIR